VGTKVILCSNNLFRIIEKHISSKFPISLLVFFGKKAKKGAPNSNAQRTVHIGMVF